MIYKGVAKGKIIELEESLPYHDGQPISILVDTISGQFCIGSPEAVRLVMHKPPHLRSEDVDELEQEIEKGKLPMHQIGVFDEVKL
jgi:hypothetical protein